MSNHRVKVWDPFVRLFHWTLVAAFFIAYFVEPEGSGLAVHVWAGYYIGGIVVLRIAWGFVGTRHARFSDFAYGPFHAFHYLGSLLLGRKSRYIGHSPAGAWMVFVLLLVLASTVYTGMSVHAMEEHAGPLASLYVSSPIPNTTHATSGREKTTTGRKEANEGLEGSVESRESVMEETHEMLANATLILVIVHVLGVILASVVHHENLVRAMVTGYKRSNHETIRPPPDSLTPRPDS